MSISDFSVQVSAMTKTSATSTTTAFNIFLSKCREEQKVMFPKEKLGKPNTHCDRVLQSTCLRRRAPHKEMYWEVENNGWPTEEMVYLPRDRRKEIRSKAPAATKPRTPHKTSTPIRKSMKPHVPNMKKKFTSSRKVWPDCGVCCDGI